LRGEIFLTLQQGSDVMLQINDFAGDSVGGARPEGTAHEDAGESGSGKNCNIAETHQRILLDEPNRALAAKAAWESQICWATSPFYCKGRETRGQE
jgi:hypothetical protein